MTVTGQTLKKHDCPKCAEGELTRLNRVGYMERELLYSLGIFPWECVLCRKKSYLRDDGHADIMRRKLSHQRSTA